MARVIIVSQHKIIMNTIRIFISSIQIEELGPGTLGMISRCCDASLFERNSTTVADSKPRFGVLPYKTGYGVARVTARDIVQYKMQYMCSICAV